MNDSIVQCQELAPYQVLSDLNLILLLVYLLIAVGVGYAWGITQGDNEHKRSGR